ncbi:PQQ-dependent sugar dehydrogenase [Arundinibacter roseus]|uniref:PQQ-dependent sugar dehydrogenase n=1 Tax=Arundinibacter roseus TaxID=2070510 RepID=A0A4R4K8F1_9BACT|nr:PQQ-dependent sugar dehydrogenase [Arundinibacter roseus]TDB63957.1 PQQ-dependent sugar dehydrogenase [Arundinibacter roseus]
MIKPISLLLSATALTLGVSTGALSQTSGNLPPVETKAPNSPEYKPAFAGQTRVAGVKTTTEYEVKVLSEGLKSPWGITSLPDGRLILTEKAGHLRIVAKDGKLSEPITGLPAVHNKGQGGLLGITLDPDFAKNRMVYWAFSEPQTDGNLTAVAKGKLSADETKIESATVIYRATPAFNGNLHYGGRVLFDKKGNLILSTGERSDIVTRPQAQSLESGLGKVIRITTDGKPVKGNPFAGKGNARPELYSYGHRNVQGLAIHPVTGDLWETEFGPRGGDEVNRVEAGKNYGWPIITFGIEYSGKKVGDVIQEKDGMQQPVYYWDPSVSPSGITFYSGNAIPEWQNNLFVGALSGMHIARLVIDKNNRVVGEERLLADQNQRFRDVTMGKDGALYAVTDQGRLYRIGKK